VAIAACALGGHPQIFVYGLALALFYAVFSIACLAGGWRSELTGRYVVMFIAGLAMAGVQLIPLAELGDWSLRHQLSFADFTSYALTPRELLLFFFPRLLGSQPGFGIAYFGPWNLTELATYAGISTLLLAIAAFGARSREPEVVFWGAVAIVCVLYALGPTTPLAQTVFHVPVINQFRVPARTAFITTLAIAVLAGFGYRAIVQGRLKGMRTRRLVHRGGLLLVAAIGLSFVAYPGLTATAAANGIQLASWGTNAAVLTPLVVMAVSSAAVIWLLRGGRYRVPLLLVALIVDLGTFGWYCEWRNGPPSAQIVPDPTWQHFAGEVRRGHGRALFLHGTFTGHAAGRPNLNLLYGLPTAGSYGPLVLREYAEVMGVDSTGGINSLKGLRQRLQLAATGWLISGDASKRSFDLGGDCSPRPGLQEAVVTLATAASATHLEIVSQMFCSVAVPQDAPVLAITVRDDQTASRAEVRLHAGQDTAEWAIDRADVPTNVAHGRPRQSETYPAGDFTGRWYRATIPLSADGVPVDVASLALLWLQSPPAGINIRAIELVDTRSGARRRIDADDMIWGGDLTPAESRTLPGAGWVRRVQGVGEPAWLVAHALATTRSEALEIIRRGRLPDGDAYDPYATLLLTSDETALPPSEPRPNVGQAHVLTRENGRITIEVDSPVDAYLVVAESFYPGWNASIDGNSVPVAEANLAFQAVRVPVGKHVVVFSFFPQSLLLGLGAATAGLAVLFLYLPSAHRMRRARRSAGGPRDACAERIYQT
jgi:Bacterial membrane protein YfhO